jgi:hypothetical protein
MNQHKMFKTFRERGECRTAFYGAGPGAWIQDFEALGRLRALRRRSAVGTVHSPRTVKPTACRVSTGYFCEFKPTYFSAPYTPKQVDFFLAYVIPQDVWYIIPAPVLIGPPQKQAAMLCPIRLTRKNRYRYEQIREAWNLLLPVQEKRSSRSKPKSKLRQKPQSSQRPRRRV